MRAAAAQQRDAGGFDAGDGDREAEAASEGAAGGDGQDDREIGCGAEGSG
jgi:hypothetical protein